MLHADGKCPEFEDFVLEFSVDLKGATFEVPFHSEDYSVQENAGCSILFKPSKDDTSRFGLRLLEKFIVTFDSDGERIGFTERIKIPSGNEKFLN